MGDVPAESPTNSTTNNGWLKKILWFGVVIVITGLVLFLYNSYQPNRPVDYADDVQHFKYGSIGTDIENGIPLRVLRVLPRMFPEYLPEGSTVEDYTAFGMISEEGHTMPIGFSERRRFIDLAGPNCAICHVGSVRAEETSPPQIILGMPANTLDFFGFFQFLFDCAGDWRFTADRIIAEMEQDEPLNLIDQQIYKLVVPFLRGQLLTRQARLSFLFEPEQPPFGTGRVDTFNTFKFDQFAEYYQGVEIDDSELIGIVDFPSIWNQRPREGLQLHWDGNNDSVHERNFSAAIAAGATRENVDIERMVRVEDWLWDFPAPEYPFAIDQSQVQRGQEIFRQTCAGCHALGGARVGTVIPLADIGTDRHRLDSYTEQLRQAQIAYTAGYPWAFTHFRKTDGYAPMPLDGIWARAPYLHNGSVPTLQDLLQPADQRPQQFYTGDDVYLPDAVGFRHDVPTSNDRQLFLLDVQVPGNSNQGHSGATYGTELSPTDKAALIEYLKTQ